MATKTKDLLSTLGRRGPHRVDLGDLGFTGIAGSVHAPADVSGPAPLIGFAHDWTRSPRAYSELGRHLASWGFVVVMPGTSTSPLARHEQFAERFSAALENTLAATLGSGRVRADARRIGLAGHGMGASVAGALATVRTDITSVAMAFPAPISPPLVDRAPLADMPALLLSADSGVHGEFAEELSLAWRGRTVLRRLDKASDGGLVESNPLLSSLGLAGGDRPTRAAAWPLLTGWLLATVAGDDTYAALASGDIDDKQTAVKGAQIVTPEMLEKEAGKPVKGLPPATRFLKAVTS